MIDLDLSVRAAGLNGTLLLGNGGGAEGLAQPDRWGKLQSAGRAARHSLSSLLLCRLFLLPCCRENTIERVSLQQLPAGEVTIFVSGANISDELAPGAYALVVQGDFRWGAHLGWRAWAVAMRLQCTPGSVTRALPAALFIQRFPQTPRLNG